MGSQVYLVRDCEWLVANQLPNPLLGLLTLSHNHCVAVDPTLCTLNSLFLGESSHIIFTDCGEEQHEGKGVVS